MTQPRILVFDSGVGGLSIAREIQEYLPGVCITFASDNAAFPYGTKTEAELCERIDLILHRFLQLAPADIVVVGCNTASTLALPRIRKQFDIPIIGVVPAIKPAAESSRSKTIGVLATPATVERPYTQGLINEFAADCKVIMQGSAELVELAEAKLRGQSVSHEALTAILQPLFDQPGGDQIDTLVLACTHFPLLQPELENACPRRVHWIDSGAAIARRTEYLIQQLGLPLTDKSTPPGIALFSKACSSIEALKPMLSALKFTSIGYTDPV